MILTDARTRVRTLVDDEDSEQFDDDEVDEALETAQFEALSHVVSSGSNLFTQETSLTTDSSGQLSLTSQKPLKIMNVSSTTGTTRIKVPPTGLQDVWSPYAAAQSLVIAYVPRPTFPASGAASFVWSHANVSNPVLDQFMVACAASELKIKEGEINPGLEKRKEELRAALDRLVDIPSWRVLPLRSTAKAFGFDLRYCMTSPDVLQLVYT